MKKLLLTTILTTILLTTGCSSFQNSMEKMGKGMSSSDYIVIMYSGGEVVNWWYIKDKIVNTEEGSDGYFWIDDNRLRRVSGDVVIEEIKGLDIEEVKQSYGIE